MHRRVIVHTPFLLAETASLSSRRVRRGFSPDNQIAFFFHGVLRWRVGRKQVVVDANSVLLVRGGEEFSEDHPVSGVGHGSLIVTPSHALMDELFRGRRPVAMTRPISPGVMLDLRTVLDAESATEGVREEMVLGLLVEIAATAEQPGSPNRRVIDRSKELLHSMPHENWSLDAVAREVGVSPNYLTQQFSRSEGMPFHRYQGRLRLARALAELPRCSDLTRLAFDLGFSSHSHFAAAFKAAFSVSPSRYRLACRRTLRA